MMIVIGYIIAGIGAVGLCSSVTMEIIKKEPIYMIFMKISSGIMGIGGIILAITALSMI